MQLDGLAVEIDRCGPVMGGKGLVALVLEVDSLLLGGRHPRWSVWCYLGGASIRGVLVGYWRCDTKRGLSNTERCESNKNPGPQGSNVVASAPKPKPRYGQASVEFCLGVR